MYKKRKLNTPTVAMDIDDLRSEFACNFIRGTNDETTREKKAKPNQLEFQVSGNQMKEFYESVISEDTSAAKSINKNSVLTKKTKRKTSNEKFSTTKKKVINEISRNNIDDKKLISRLKLNLLKHSTLGDLNELKLLLETIKQRTDHDDILHHCDSYGWNAHMCAAAEGRIDIVKILMKAGCKIDTKCKQEIYDICKKRKQSKVRDYIMSLEVKVEVENEIQNKEEFEMEEIVCKICGVKYLVADIKKHEASVLHIFNDKNKIKETYYIPQHNVGFQMMLRSGWVTEKGLGPSGEGRKNPIKTTLKHNRCGLGLDKKSKQRVTHFASFDEKAVKIKQDKSLNDRVEKKKNLKTFEKKKEKDKKWEQIMRRYMATDY